jgi:hypothetical protein
MHSCFGFWCSEHNVHLSGKKIYCAALIFFRLYMIHAVSLQSAFNYICDPHGKYKMPDLRK